MELMNCTSEILQIVCALGAPRRFAGTIDGGQQQGKHEGDDRHHEEQLGKRKAGSARIGG